MSQLICFDTALFLLLKGELVALPTETVYGLAGRIDKKQTLKKIFTLKKRPFFDPLIVHCYDKKQAFKYISGDTHLIELLFQTFSPGPLTIVAQKNNKISSLITAGKKTVALRIPQHPLMRRILQKLPVPLAAPSANPYGKISPVKAEHVLSFFKEELAVLEGGSCDKGLESTILQPDLQKKTIFILRPGMITKKDIQSFLKQKKLNFHVENKIDNTQPGGQNSHYKPSAPLYILETQKNKKEIKTFLLKKFPNYKFKQLLLNPSAQKTAQTLYSQMRDLSKETNCLIFVQKTAEQPKGLWEAIWNRLDKAASGYWKI